MFSLIPVVLSSLAVCLVVTPFLRDFFGFLGFVDKPDSIQTTRGPFRASAAWRSWWGTS